MECSIHGQYPGSAEYREASVAGEDGDFFFGTLGNWAIKPNSIRRHTVSIMVSLDGSISTSEEN